MRLATALLLCLVLLSGMLSVSGAYAAADDCCPDHEPCKAMVATGCAHCVVPGAPTVFSRAWSARQSTGPRWMPLETGEMRMADASIWRPPMG